MNGATVFKDRLYVVLEGRLFVLSGDKLDPVPQRHYLPSGPPLLADGGLTDMRELLIDAFKLKNDGPTRSTCHRTIGKLLCILAAKCGGTEVPAWQASIMEHYRQRAETAEAALALAIEPMDARQAARDMVADMAHRS